MDAHLVMPRHEQCQLCLGEVPDLGSTEARDGLVYMVRFNVRLKSCLFLDPCQGQLSYGYTMSRVLGESKRSCAIY